MPALATRAGDNASCTCTIGTHVTDRILNTFTMPIHCIFTSGKAAVQVTLSVTLSGDIEVTVTLNGSTCNESTLHIGARMCLAWLGNSSPWRYQRLSWCQVTGGCFTALVLEQDATMLPQSGGASVCSEQSALSLGRRQMRSFSKTFTTASYMNVLANWRRLASTPAQTRGSSLSEL